MYQVGLFELFLVFSLLFLIGLGVLALLLRRKENHHQDPNASTSSPHPSFVRRLYRSDTERALAGVCGGFAEYAGIDPVIVRLVYVIVTLLTGIVLGVLFYMLCVFIIPKKVTH